MTNAARERTSGGRVFRLSAVSGLITGVSANGVVFAWRNPSATVIQHVVEVNARWLTVAGFTAAQEVAIAGHLVSDFDETNYAGGTDLSDPASNPAYINVDENYDVGYSYAEVRSKSVLVTGNVRIATTAALTTAGTPVIQTQPFGWAGYSDLAAAATVQKGSAAFRYAPANGAVKRIGEDAGFIIRHPVALGAGGTGRLAVEVVWYER